jgi:hypothetical protein
MTNNNVLIINGKSYDALTGKLLSSSDQPSNKAHSIDGLTKPKKSKSDLAQHPSSANMSPEPARLEVPVVKKTGRSHDIILSSTFHTTSAAKPLMRNGLKKPSHSTKPIYHVQSRVDSKQLSAPKPISKIQTHDSQTRLQRVADIHRIKQVKHFSKRPARGSWDSTVNPSTPSSLSPSKTFVSVSTRNNGLQDIIEKGLQRASSHKQLPSTTGKQKHKKKHSRLKTFNITVGIIAVFIILVFVIAKNIPTIDVRIASAQSGIHAEIPGYVPTGFKFVEPIKYGQGNVTVTYSSNRGSFHIIQEQSSWDSISLRDSFVTTADPNFKVVEVAGRLVYLYGPANATWVNGGIWYQITDNANLSSANLLQIATSL